MICYLKPEITQRALRRKSTGEKKGGLQTNDNNIKNQSQEAEETGNKQTFYLQRYTADDDEAFKTDPSNQNTEGRNKKKQMADIQGGRNKICQESFEQKGWERNTGR